MIGIAIPAHNEEQNIATAVAAAWRAASHPDLHGEECRVVVALDHCCDATGTQAREAGAWTVDLAARSVGQARAMAANVLLAAGARWLAFTDADTVVSEGWLVQQLALGADAVCGSVAVQDWSCHGSHAAYAQACFEATYRDVDGHRHVHGANLGVSAQAYLRAGGFAPLGCHEDVALVRTLQAQGARIAWSAQPRVWTSARRQARVRGGFGDTLCAALDAVLPSLPSLPSLPALPVAPG
ncbi:glycosyltransferase [Xenophilus arseniciresistens]|uniref:Glycosyltransferase n=1 Tax=Xenophilus arseniciresistens TaxID=1283306 RepID=A0AAE3N513_9BURK|nr:glycosyltransferase [Xenophilus arseniciresistens]MDA7415028.1 glycosyltransferase [Xenophilus arseniciresistens]